MSAGFELFIARRYLKAKRKQAVISVITWLSVIGIAAGVAALIIALAITNGFRSTLQQSLLGATSHVSLLEKDPGSGIADWREIIAKARAIPHVISAAPSLYGYVFFAGPVQGRGGVIKGLLLDSADARNDLIRHLKEGSIDRLSSKSDYPGLIMGSRLAQATGMPLNSVVTVISPQGELTPLGPRPAYYRFRVMGIFETGFFELDSMWAFTTMESAQRVLSLGDVAVAVELKLDDIYRAPQVATVLERVAGPDRAATHWMEQNRSLWNALRMDRVVTIITIGLIEVVAAMNILIALVMMVMEKHRDIAILISMGARKEQIRRIFMAQGVIIGAAGTLIGLVVGFGVSILADRYQLIRLDAEVYSLNFVPFDPRWIDGVWVAAASLLISFLATLYPSRNAARILPAEALRYE